MFVSDMLHGWVEGIGLFIATTFAWAIVAGIAGLVAWAVVEHPIATSLVVLGGVWWLGARYGWATLWGYSKLILVLVLTVCAVVALGLLSPRLMVVAVLGLVAWAVIRWKRYGGAPR